MTILTEIKSTDMSKHSWTGDEANIKWFDLKLGYAETCEIVVPVLATSADYDILLDPEQDGNSFHRCRHCQGVWDTEVHPDIVLEPFTHLTCPLCGKILWQKFNNKYREEKS